jgi:hypothetical protein
MLMSNMSIRSDDVFQIGAVEDCLSYSHLMSSRAYTTPSRVSNFLREAIWLLRKLKVLCDSRSGEEVIRCPTKRSGRKPKRSSSH